ncbi:MAG TPA: S8 family serine peptidase, partial [Candidatus Saccharimonadales bacterium]|nr:S8 family serine peptidase [Candidatus Saccharimonadales bacterium]
MRRRVLTPADGTVPAQQGGLHVLGFPGPVRPAWLRALREVPGIRVLGAAPENGYVVWLPPDSETALERLPMAPEILARLDAADRLSPDLDSAADPLEVAIFFISTPRGRAALSAAGDLSRTPPARAPEMAGLAGAVLTLSRRDLDTIAGWNEMVWAEPWGKPHLDDEVSDLITAGAVSGGLPLGPDYRQWLASHGLDDLSAYTVDVMDTGIDTGLSGAEHEALAGRVVFSTNETLETGADDCVGHGTHIAGIIAGNPPAGYDLTDADGYEYGLGLAPTARLGSSRIFTCAGNMVTRRSFTEILTQAWDEGARISNNSWGIGGSAYSSVAAEYDAIVRDVDRDPSDGDQPMVVVVSSGNGGPADYTVTNPAVAKNVITVGGSESVRPEATDGCGTGPEGADDAGELKTTSSRGPTTDGRLKPDLVAPGSHIVSTVSQSPSYGGLGLCNTFYPPDQRLYTWTSGTSQSAAHVSGASVLVMEDYRRQFGRTPSPAMIKAELVATAWDLARSNDIFTQPIPARPSNGQGWGRVNLSHIIGERFREAFDQEKVFASSGEEQQLGPFIVADPARPVSVVLAWTDAPGMPAASAWVNDLDLQVTTPTEVYLGNVFDKGYSVTGGTPDGKNNLEAVILRPGTTDTFSVNVSAVSLAGDGVPSEPGVTDQDFALYLDNVIDARAAGRLSLDSADYSCDGPAKVIVTDHGLAGTGRAHVLASSTTETAGELLDLSEDPAGTGIFRGEIPLSAGTPGSDGIVQVADGDILNVSYRDADAGDGTPATVSASAHIHCSPLEISQVRVESIGTSGAVISWKTNRPADSTVTSGGEILYRDPARVADHRAVLRGLDTCASYPFEIASADDLGGTASAPLSGSLALSTSSGQKIPLFEDDLESTLVGWVHAGPGDDWEIGTPQIGPPHAASGTRVWGTNLDGAYDPNEDSYLQMPPVDLKGLRDAELRFMQYMDIPLAGVTGGPQDGAWVEASTDGGKTWLVLSPDTGYPVSAGPGNPWLPPQSGVYAGTSSGWSAVRMNLSPFGGGTVRIRFRFRADPSSPGPPGAGWYIDDVSVGADFPCGTGTLALDSQEYGCRSSVRITLADQDVDLNPLVPGFASAVAVGPAGPVAVQLRETAANSGIFTGRFALSPVHEPGALMVPEGESFTVRYEDREDG